MIDESYCPLVLGTVQFGLPYGIANKTGQPDQRTVNDIVSTAWSYGIREFDTAQDYGISEQVLGIALAKLSILSEARVVSKIDPNLDHCNYKAMTKALDQSLIKLGVPCLFGLMLHKQELLCKWSIGLGDILQSFIKSGKVKKLGVSVYSPDKAEEALNLSGIDIVQVPSNILDRRFERKNIFETADKKNKIVYIRSVFLQGLILMDQEVIPEHMLFVLPVISKIKSLALKLNLTKQELAILYLKYKTPNAKLVIGADTPQHIKNTVVSWRKDAADEIISLVAECFDQVEERILNPSLWEHRQ